MPFSLDRKVAIVTGASGGLGAVVSRELASAGARVFLGDVVQSGGESVASEITANGGHAEYVRLDVTEEQSWKSLVDLISKVEGRLDILVNNAGITRRAGLMDMAIDDWQRIINVNLTGPMLGMRAAAPLMKSSGGGSIVNIGSLAGVMGHPVAAYAASKWGLRGISKSAALELVDWNIRVNVVHPGIVETPIISGANAFRSAMETFTPMQRVAEPIEVAALVLFLASDESSFITGVDIPVDGGFQAAGAYRHVWKASAG